MASTKMGSPKRTGVADLPLHYGKAPPWLFQRMVALSREVAGAMVEEYGPAGLLQRLSDPFWFQALGCVSGFDWHSSGLTTTVCGALKLGVKGLEREMGIYIAGGKGRASRKTPSEIEAIGDALSIDPQPLVYASRICAKVDSAALQDGYQIYHHTFIFTAAGEWAVVQQGMNEATRYARRYHWLGELVTDYVCEPHAAICSDASGTTLNLVATESASAREAIARIAAAERPDAMVRELEDLKSLTLPHRHHVALEDIHPRRLEKIFLSAYERKPADFESLLALEGVGPKAMRALALVAELVYGAPASARDPARYSYAHGGKDGHPYPVDRATYDKTIEVMATAVRRARIGQREGMEALRRVYGFYDKTTNSLPNG